jgi:parafibromin
MDPLSALREYTTRSELDRIKRVGDEYHFGDDYRFPCSIETAYRSKQGSLYTLESLIYFLENQETKHTDYMQQAHALKLQIVTFIDRKALLGYLQGKLQSTEAIELLAPSTAPSLHMDPATDEDVEEYRPDDPAFLHSKRSRLDDSVAGEFGSAAEQDLDPAQIIAFIKERERPIRDRNTILLCHNKDFQEIFTMLTKRDEEKKKADENRDKQQAGADNETAYPHKQQNLKKDGKLKPDGIRPMHSQHHASQSQHHAAPPRSLPLVAASSSLKAGKGEAEPPIILVPSAFQTMLNMYNAKEFLEDGMYVSADVKAKELPKKPEVVRFVRKMGRETPIKYEVRDKISGLSPKDWDRVVAVFVLGKEWQFKDWPFKDHVEILSKSKALSLWFSFYFHAQFHSTS